MSCQAVIDYAHRYAELARADRISVSGSDQKTGTPSDQHPIADTRTGEGQPVTSVRRASPTRLYSS